jgi:hypothetical protein
MNGYGEFIWKEGKKKFWFFIRKKKNGFDIFFGKIINFFVDFGKMENKMDLENFYF